MDANCEVQAYELLYRPTRSDSYDGTHGDHATSRVLANAFMTIGLEALTAGRPAYVNFTAQGLLDDYPTLLPPEQLVIEVLETVVPDDAVVAACRALKERGFRLAMDDLVELSPGYEALHDLADVLKVDWRRTSPEARRHLARQAGGRTLLAEKVETHEEFEEAKALGYHLFQGYFLSRPLLVTAQDVPTFKQNQLRLLREVRRPELDLSSLEAVIAAEVSLSYKLLKYLNSPAFGFRYPLKSLRHALVALGERDLRKWVSMVCLTSIGADRPQELAVQSLIRGHFCEQLGALVGLVPRSDELFMTGLFSLLDSLVGRPLDECLAPLDLATTVRGALLGQSGQLGQLLSSVTAYERGDWAAMWALADEFGLEAERIPETYVRSVILADTMFAES